METAQTQSLVLAMPSYSEKASHTVVPKSYELGRPFVKWSHGGQQLPTIKLCRVHLPTGPFEQKGSARLMRQITTKVVTLHNVVPEGARYKDIVTGDGARARASGFHLCTPALKT